MNKKFEVLFLEDVVYFFNEIDEDAKNKIIYNIEKAQVLNDPRLLKKLTDTIWEFRTNYRNIQYRLLAFWDKTNGQETLVVATHGIIKKTSKVPVAEIEKSDRIRTKYFTKDKSI